MKLRHFLANASVFVLLAATGCCGIGYDAHCLLTSSAEIPLEEEAMPLAPVPRFHPAPTRPVFSSAVYAESPLLESQPLESPLLDSPSLDLPPAATTTEQVGPSVPEGAPAVEQIGPGVPNAAPAQISPQPEAKLLAPPAELLAPPNQQHEHQHHHGHGDSNPEKNAPRTAASQQTGRKWLRR